MDFYKCKRDIWSPSPFPDFPDVLSFKKNNLYIVKNERTEDEEGEEFSFKDKDEGWLQRHFETI